MRLRVTFPPYIAADRSFTLIDTLRLDEIRDHIDRAEPLLIDNVGYAPITLELNALERLLACVEIRTESGDCLKLDGTGLLLNGTPVATLPRALHNASLSQIRTQYTGASGRFVSIVGSNGGYIFDLHTHQVIDATLSTAATAQRAAGGAA